MRRILAPLLVSLIMACRSVADGPTSSGVESQEANRVGDASRKARHDRMFLQETVREIWTVYHGAIAEICSTEEQRKKLLGLLVEQREAETDASLVSISLGAKNDSEVGRSVVDAHSSISSEIHELIGDDGIRALKRAEAFAVWRQNLQGNVVADLAIGGVPLSPGQEKALVGVYVDSQPLWDNGAAPPKNEISAPSVRLPGLSDPDQKILIRATGFLTAAQAAVLRESLVNSEKETVLMQVMHSSRIGASLLNTPTLEEPKALANDSSNPTRQEVGPSPDEVVIRYRATLRNEWVNYHEIIDGLDLAPEIGAKLLKLLAARDQATRDALDASRAAGLTKGEEINRSQVDAFNSITSELVNLIGNSGFQALRDGQDFDAQLTDVRRTIGVDMAMANTPLDPSQETALAHIMQEVMEGPLLSTRDSNGRLLVNPRTGLLEIYQRILDRASLVLSAAQMPNLQLSLLASEEE